MMPPCLRSLKTPTEGWWPGRKCNAQLVLTLSLGCTVILVHKLHLASGRPR